MSHSKMLATRRRKKRGKKELARIAKRAKKLGTQNVKADGADMPKKSSADPH